MIARTMGIAGVSAVVALFSAGALAAQKPVSLGETISETFTIEAINHSARIVSLKDQEGFVEDVVAGPEVKRFDALKVGDRVTFRYYESLVTALRRADAAKKAPDAASVNRTPGDRPGGTVSQQMTTVVTVEAIDAKVPSVTIKTADGRRMSFKVENAKNLAGYKAGDNVEITYTRALAVSVEPAK